MRSELLLRFIIRRGPSWHLSGRDETGAPTWCPLPDRAEVFNDLTAVEAVVAELEAITDRGTWREPNARFVIVALPLVPATIVDCNLVPVHNRTVRVRGSARRHQVHAWADPDRLRVSLLHEDGGGSYHEVNRPAVRVGDGWVRRSPQLQVVDRRATPLAGVGDRSASPPRPATQPPVVGSAVIADSGESDADHAAAPLPPRPIAPPAAGGASPDHHLTGRPAGRPKEDA